MSEGAAKVSEDFNKGQFEMYKTLASEGLESHFKSILANGNGREQKANKNNDELIAENKRLQNKIIQLEKLLELESSDECVKIVLPLKKRKNEVICFDFLL